MFDIYTAQKDRPSHCPFSYVFLKNAEQIIKEIAPGISIRRIDSSIESDEARKRGNIKGCIVNTKPIKLFVLDKEDFQKEVTEALKLFSKKDHFMI